ncbi:MAG: L-serine ammonia-lyase [Desulfobacteraceae bacterium]|uniref:L-serine dehydratase n=1 Tax=Candidatus Desulfacyla euxinica TaxID=2841693 RepID=A0A8J6MWK9_9DELT|nr:L-serine ammonia-lyase [Candidatus Desulfacyla euxinica]MBL6979520.1 L-serine ammonia-lyase [Desulfobacteraceae bacterium]
MYPVTTSLFEFFKIGPGPSSSHTIGPMKAGYDFLCSAGEITGAARIDVHLYGSLSATGKGHGTDRAVLAGLMGNPPERCPEDLLDSLMQNETIPQTVTIGNSTLQMAVSDVVFDKIQHEFPFSNTLVIRLLDVSGTIILEKEYYSVGGGFIQWKGWKPPERGEPVYEYENVAHLSRLLDIHNLGIDEIILENEKAITGKSEKEIMEQIDVLMKAMETSVERGLRTDGLLPGDLGMHRKAPTLYENGRTLSNEPDRFITQMSSYALASAEENAAGHRIVTAPTCGAAGVMPAVYYTMKHHFKTPAAALRKGFLAAATVGFLCKHNASIAGAEVGCQGEIGVATSMAAAMLVYSKHTDSMLAAHAAAIGLEHQLGLTCDPVGGYVQIPCIERNAIAAVKAYNSSLIATLEVPSYHKVPLDAVIQAMAENGRDMDSKYKETSMGGLAVSMVNC